jgi:alcohol dehydrogenase class IV
MQFEFATSARIVFGPGSMRAVAPAARALGRRVLLVTGRSLHRSQALETELANAGLHVSRFSIADEPTVQQAAEGAALTRRQHCELVIGMGGGSAIDGAKAIAALATNPSDPLEYLEVIGKGQPLDEAPLPFIAIPTTAGTGSEVTRNAVLAAPEQKVKVSLRSSRMLARLAVVDPELTFDLPPEITAATGLDALTQVIEPYVSIRANALTDLFCAEGMLRVRRSLMRAFQNGQDREARTDMSYASLLGGLSLANAGLGVVHGFAGPIGGMFDAPHGAICAALLPYGVDVNVKALRARGQSVERFQHAARILTGLSQASADDAAAWLHSLCERLEVKPLRHYGVGPEHVTELVEKAAQSSSMKGNCCALSRAEMEAVLAPAL